VEDFVDNDFDDVVHISKAFSICDDDDDDDDVCVRVCVMMTLLTRFPEVQFLLVFLRS